jgi:teichoic acid transport system permease protein
VAPRVAAPAEDDEFVGTHHVYEKYRAGLPRLRPYFRELWRRREFAVEMSRAGLRAQNANTALGQLWNILNPLLLGVVYWVLVTILRGGVHPDPAYFPHLLAGLFAFYMVSQSMTGGVGSVVSAGRIVMNTAFPRLLLPIAEVRTAVVRFLPTMIVLAAAFIIAGLTPSPVLLLAIPWFVLLVMFAAGLAMTVATLQVYFRDTRSFLPYVNRIWLYVSPVLWFAADVPQQLRALEFLNPLFSLLGGWSEILVHRTLPGAALTVQAVGWATASLLVGMVLFMTRERDFAVRI